MRTKRLASLRDASRTALLAAAVAALVGAGGGVAASTALISGADVRNNSLTGADVRNNSLTGADIRNGSLRGVDIRNRSVGISDLSRAAVKGLRGQRGPAGPPGAGVAAAGGLAPGSITYVQGADVALLVAAGEETREASLEARCPAGSKAVSGGFAAANPVLLKRSGPSGDGSGWRTTVVDPLTVDGIENVLTPSVVCIAG